MDTTPQKLPVVSPQQKKSTVNVLFTLMHQEFDLAAALRHEALLEGGEHDWNRSKWAEAAHHDKQAAIYAAAWQLIWSWR